MAITKYIREKLGVSQEDFAKMIGVSYVTVNRWENGHSGPTVLAQKNIAALCEKEGIELIDFVRQRVADCVQEANIPADRTVLYHGSKAGLVGDLKPNSRDKCDFGVGFYMGTDPLQPLTLICDYEKAAFYIMSLKTEGLRITEVPADIEWAMLVAYHRGKMERIRGTALYRKYETFAENSDVFVGSIANDRMFYVLDNFFKGTITDKALVNSLSTLQLGLQYVAVTQRGCDAVRVEREVPMTWMEKECIKAASAKNRELGIAQADDICKRYRREGLFFDELLDAAEGRH
jgi:transcriptional regulator with XRE-family HTH domain